MTTGNLRKARVGPSLLVAALSIFLLGVGGAPTLASDDDEPSYLFVCAGDQARTAPDFLAVISFTEGSKD